MTFQEYKEMIKTGPKTVWRSGVSYITGIPMRELMKWERTKRIPPRFLPILEMHKVEIKARAEETRRFVEGTLALVGVK